MMTVAERNAVIVAGLKRLIEEIESSRCDVVAADECLYGDNFSNAFEYMEELLGGPCTTRKVQIFVTASVDEYKRRHWLGLFPPNLSWGAQDQAWREAEADRKKDEASAGGRG